jgi:hypothetical protein
MLVINFVPTFSDNSMLFSAEDVAWQFRGSVVDGRVYLCIDTLLASNVSNVVHQYQIVKHLMLNLHLFGVGIDGCSSINNDFGGFGGNFKEVTDQLESIYFMSEEKGLVTLKVHNKLAANKVLKMVQETERQLVANLKRFEARQLNELHTSRMRYGF